MIGKANGTIRMKAHYEIIISQFEQPGEPSQWWWGIRNFGEPISAGDAPTEEQARTDLIESLTARLALSQSDERALTE
jgi:hypothetical protein